MFKVAFDANLFGVVAVTAAVVTGMALLGADGPTGGFFDRSGPVRWWPAGTMLSTFRNPSR